jgi:hypothetical protein
MKKLMGGKRPWVKELSSSGVRIEVIEPNKVGTRIRV